MGLNMAVLIVVLSLVCWATNRCGCVRLPISFQEQTLLVHQDELRKELALPKESEKGG